MPYTFPLHYRLSALPFFSEWFWGRLFSISLFRAVRADQNSNLKIITKRKRCIPLLGYTVSMKIIIMVLTCIRLLIFIFAQQLERATAVVLELRSSLRMVPMFVHRLSLQSYGQVERPGWYWGRSLFPPNPSWRAFRQIP